MLTIKITRKKIFEKVWGLYVTDLHDTAGIDTEEMDWILREFVTVKKLLDPAEALSRWEVQFRGKIFLSSMAQMHLIL